MTYAASISPKGLAELSASGDVEVIDVRTPVKFREAHLPMARNVPLDALDARQVQRERNGATDRPLYVICRSGARASKACQTLLEAGCTDVVNVEGGTQAWIDAGLPVVRGKKTISLERQVRIVAGGIVLVGAVLAMIVHPYFAAISAFIGAGLLLAGLTDTCGMGMILARMPWNQTRDAHHDDAAGCRR